MSVTPEFSRPCALERLPAGGLAFDVEASPAERAALARRFDLAGLERLEAGGRVEPVPGPGGLFEVTGRLRAELSQRCVVTFEPVPAAIDTEFRRLFTREAGPPVPAGAELEVDLDADVPEPLGENGLDLGELAAEEMAVALDPYPRAPNADTVLAEVAARAAEEDRGPFAALAPLRPGSGDGDTGSGPH